MKTKSRTYFILLYALVIIILFSVYIFDKGMAFGKTLAH